MGNRNMRVSFNKLVYILFGFYAVYKLGYAMGKILFYICG